MLVKTKTWFVLTASVAGAFMLTLLAPQISPAQPAQQGQLVADGEEPAPQPGRGAGGRGGRGGGPAVDTAAMETLFTQRCKGCHEPPLERAPSRADFRQRTANSVIEALTSGAMQNMATGLTTAQIRDVAVYLTGLQPGQAVPVQIKDVACAAHPPIKMIRASWNRFGVDLQNTRFQPNPGLTVRQVPRLKLKWAFSFRAGAYGQPIVVGDRLFITSQSGGGFYSLDARTGCVHWKVDTVTVPGGAAPLPFNSRTTPMIENRPDISPSGWVTFVSGPQNRVFAFDAQDGKQLWASEPLETAGRPRLTGAPILYQDKLFAPVSSLEEVGSTGPCCVFRGSLVALNPKTGERLWKTAVITEAQRPSRMNAAGIQLQGPAGAAIWSSPTVDPKRNQVYVTTGNSYTEVPTRGANAVHALDMTTGAIKWTTQTFVGDNYLVGCNRPNARTGALPMNCATPPGPDFDYGSSVILQALPGGGDILLAGQKSSMVHGLNPDTGAVIWGTKVGTGSTLGGIEWGMGSDSRYVYAPNSDLITTHEVALRQLGQMPTVTELPPEARPGLTALELATGKIAWHVPAPRVPCNFAPGASRTRVPNCFNAQSAAPSVMPGAVFSGTTDGRMRAYDTRTGQVIWEYDTTAQTYDTVNGVKGQPGGSIDSMGPAIAGGMVYTMSGYAGSAGVGSNNPNVLLAFSIDGK